MLTQKPTLNIKKEIEMNLLQFLLINKTSVFFAMFATLAFVGFVNLLHNAYAKQNAKLKTFSKRVMRKPSSIIWETKRLPQVYQRQWRAFVNSGATKPSVVFEFVKRPHKYLLWFAHFVACVLCVAYVCIAILLQDQTMLVTQITFALFSVLLVLLSHLLAKINLAHARRVFGKFLHNLNCVVQIVRGEQIPTTQNAPVQPCQVAESPAPSDSPTPQADLQSQSPAPQSQSPSLPKTPPPVVQNSSDTVENAIKILRQKGLDNPRTIEEQRKLNIALNNLLQACCKK